MISGTYTSVQYKDVLLSTLINALLPMFLIYISESMQKQPSRGVLGKGIRKIHSKLTGEHSCRTVISIKLQSNFIEITLRHECSRVNLLHISRTPFCKMTSGGLFLSITVHLQRGNWCVVCDTAQWWMKDYILM